MSFYTMSDHAVNVPEFNTVDSLAEQRDARDARTRARMSQKAYKDAILQRISDAMDDERHPLGELVDRLFDCPLRDEWDYRGYLGMYDGKRIGATVLTMICDSSLEAYQEADIEGF
jgi:hypothetical protein